MKALTLFLVSIVLLWGQNTVYLRSSGPAAAYVTNAIWNGSTYQVTTATAHGLAAGDTVLIHNVCTGTTASALNNIRKVGTVVDPTDFTVLTPAGENLTNNGSWASCGAAAWVGKLTAYTTAEGPLGVLDGKTGPIFRKLALSTANSNVASGLADTGSCPGDGVCVSGQTGSPASGGVVTLTTTFAHGVQPTSVGGQTESLGIWGSSSKGLNTNGTYNNSNAPGIPGASYPVIAATTYTITLAAPPGVSNGDYTHNDHCGTSGNPYDVINGSANCLVISQVAYDASTAVTAATYQGGGSFSGTGTCYIDIRNYATYNSGSDALGTIQITGGAAPAIGTPIAITSHGYGFVSPAYATQGNASGACGGILSMSSTLSSNPANPAWERIQSLNTSLGVSDPIGYRTTWDGGQQVIGNAYASNYSNAAITFLVDQSNQSLANVVIYSLDYIQRHAGVNFAYNETQDGDGFAQYNFYIPWQVIAGFPLMSPTEQATVANMIYNDIDDPMGSPGCSTVNTSLQNNYLNVYSGTLGATTSATAQLDAGAPSYDVTGYAVGVRMGQASYTVGSISAYDPSRKVATISNWTNGAPSSGSSYLLLNGGTLSAGSSTQATYGNAQGGTSNTITFAAGTTGDYKHDEVYLPLTNQRAFITDYNTDTLVATVSPAWTAIPGSGSYYSVSTTAMVTGIGTTFTSLLAPGDELAVNGSGSMVVYVASNTVAYVVNIYPTNPVPYPGSLLYVKAWAPGDCGDKWRLNHGGGTVGKNAMYPPIDANGHGFEGRADEGINYVNMFSIVPRMMADWAFLPYDSRASYDLSMHQAHWFDFQMRHYMNYGTGPAHSGSDYQYGTTVSGQWIATWLTMNGTTGASPSYPSLGATNPWLMTGSIWKEFEQFPEWPGGYPYLMNFESTQSAIAFQPAYWGGWVLDGAVMFEPDSTLAARTRSLMESFPSTTQENWGNAYQPYAAFALETNLPTVGSSDWTNQPHQYYFGPFDSTLCASLTGWECPSGFGGFAVVSRTGFWDPYHTSHGSQTDSQLTYQSRTYWNDYDCVENGHVQLYKVGYLLAPDTVQPDNCGFGNNTDFTSSGDMLQFGGNASNVLQGDNVTPPQPGLTPITAWAGTNSYGDPNSQYMRVCSNLAGAYSTAISIHYAYRCVDELKPTSGDHFVFQWDSVSTGTPTSIATHVHYPQNGESAGAAAVFYPEGNTTCPGSGGCGSLNASRWVQELESGVGDGNGSDPTPTFGLITNFLSPGNIFLSWDGATFTGSQGHTDRVTICAGSGSCSGSATSLESLQVHKIAGDLSYTSLTTQAITTDDGHWFGAQAFGVNSCAVIMEARGGSTYSAMNFMPPVSSGVCANNVQYLFGGLTPGYYTITIGGSPISGSPFSVASGDSSVTFTSSPGVVSVSATGAPTANHSTALKGATTVTGNPVIR